MKLYLGLAAIAAAFAANPALAAPDIASCPEPEALEDMAEEFENEATLPPELKEIAVTDGKRLAVTTLSGATICEDVQWVYGFVRPAFVMTERFFGMGWTGMEAFGYRLVDRAAKGTMIETGEAPVFSDGMHRMASLQFSEAGFGGLEGFVVWNVTEKGVKKIFELNSMNIDETMDEMMVYRYVDLRIDGFVGQNCVRISGVAPDEYSRAAGEGDDLRFATRTEFYAREDKGWKITPGLSTGCIDD